MKEQGHKVRCWLSRQRTGLYMLTHQQPVLAKVGKTEELDLYIPYGDGIGYRHMCNWSAKAIFGLELQPLEMAQVWLQGGRLDVKDESSTSTVSS